MRCAHLVNRFLGFSEPVEGAPVQFDLPHGIQNCPVGARRPADRPKISISQALASTTEASSDKVFCSVIRTWAGKPGMPERLE
jgi:hypothetical protein